MLTFNSRVVDQFKKLADAQIANCTQELTAGLMTPDQYHNRCGRIYALKEAKELADEALSICEGKETRST